MQLTDAGESRVRGYLYVLSRSLRTFLPPALVEDALREVESHIRERLSQQPPSGDERGAVEAALRELGTPQQVAQAYSTEMTVEEAVTTGRFVPVLRAVWHYATTSVVGFAWAMAVFVGWVLGLSIALIAPLKVVFPNNVGIFYVDGRFNSAGAILSLPPGAEVYPFGYWVVPVALAVGVAILVGTQRASRRVLGWLRSRQAPARIRVRLEVAERP